MIVEFQKDIEYNALMIVTNPPSNWLTTFWGYVTSCIDEEDCNTGEYGEWLYDYEIGQEACEGEKSGDYFDGHVGGFQFELPGISISYATAPDGFTVTTSEQLLLGFSLTGATIPAGCGTLVELSLEGEATGLSGIILSDSTGNQLYCEYYEDDTIAGCTDESACNYNAIELPSNIPSTAW